MSKWVEYHLPCPKCHSSDAFSVNDRGWGKCFSCGVNLPLDNKEEKKYVKSKEYAFVPFSKESDSLVFQKEHTKQVLPYRGLNEHTLKVYNSKVRVGEDGAPYAIEFPYGDLGCKVRAWDRKEFMWDGKTDQTLFGMDRFPPANIAVMITEGEIDAMSAYQMMGGKIPVVSVRNAQGGRSDCEKAYKYLNSFEKIYLALDNDDPGQKASVEIAKLFDINKVYHVQLGEGLKDANAYLTEGRAEQFNKAYWNAKKFLPKGIINSYDDIKATLLKNRRGSIADYPFATLQEMTYGIREGELVLFTAQEKVGKTEIIRAIEHHLLKTTEENMGIIHLEEEEKRSVQGLLSYELDTPVHLPDCQATVDEQLEAYKKLTKRDGRVHYYTHFGSDDPDTILDTIRYLVGVCHCKFIFLDHITMLVTGYEGDDERKKLDYISTRLAMLTRELGFTLFLVSHVNDNGQTRGSRNISKVADLIVHLDRDNESADYDTRNTTALLVKGNRFAGVSGPAGHLIFNPHTYQVKEKTLETIAEATPF